MKPTKSEIRGTWMLAAICALLLVVATLWSRCGRADSEGVAIQLPEETAAIDPAATAVDTICVKKGAAHKRHNREKVSKSKSSRTPSHPVSDNPSPLDRPL